MNIKKELLEKFLVEIQNNNFNKFNTYEDFVNDLRRQNWEGTDIEIILEYLFDSCFINF